MGNFNEVQVFRIHQPQNAKQSLIRLDTVMKKKKKEKRNDFYIANIKSWESTLKQLFNNIPFFHEY